VCKARHVRILVTGATGFIGLEVARQLADAGHRPRVMVRRISRAPLLGNLDVEAVHGDLESTPSLARAVQGIDAVIHLGGRATFESYDRLRPTIVDGTAALARAAADAGVAHVVYGSSLFVHDGTTAVTDETVPNPLLGYGRAKLDAEAVLSEVTRSGGPTAACIRLPHVYGPQSLLFGLVRRRWVVFPGRGSNPFAQLHVEDAARVLIAAAEQRWSGTASVADEHTVTWNDFFDVLTTFAPRTRVVRVPASIAATGAALAGAALGRLGPTMLSVDTVRGWNLSLPVATRRLWDALSLEPDHPTVMQGIPATLDGAVAFRWRHPVFDRS
jgi:nucleoside-diphosphate-sugar epimerase